MDNFAVRDKGRAVMVPGDGMLFAFVVLTILTATDQSAVQMTWPRGSR